MKIFDILQAEIKKHQTLAPMALRVIIQLYDFPLSFEALGTIMNDYDFREHRIESLTEDEVTLILI